MSEQHDAADKQGRVARKLRISVTDRCNFRCRYCMPDEPRWSPSRELLSYEQISQLAELFVARLGIRELRLTGGEPLVRRDLPKLVLMLDGLRERGLLRLSLTSNGSLLGEQASALRAAGLDDVNISLDALEAAAFARLSGVRVPVSQVLSGIDRARQAGLGVKINCVLIRGHNDDQILPLVDWARRAHLELRFIEFMPLEGGRFWGAERVVTEAQLLAQLAQHYQVRAEPRSASPARRFVLDGRQHIGIISTVSRPFCDQCDRLRLTAKGELYSCLFDQGGCALGEHINGPPELLEARIRQAIWGKPKGYVEHRGRNERPLVMHQLGG